jgi:hypothetical protein
MKVLIKKDKEIDKLKLYKNEIKKNMLSLKKKTDYF